MDAKERAEKIRKLLDDPWGSPIANDIVQALIVWVEAQIEEAEREAATKCDHESPCCDDCIDKFKEQGRKEVYAGDWALARNELLKEVANKFQKRGPLGEGVANEIRSMQSAPYVDRYAEGFRAAKEKAKGIAETLMNEKQKCSPENKEHDIRWCPTCESMEDAYGVIAQRISEMQP